MLLRRLFSPRTLEFRDGCLAGAVHLATVAAHTFVADATAETLSADEAKEISGRTNIPVVVFPDGTHQVEPRNEETAAKLEELGLV